MTIQIRYLSDLHLEFIKPNKITHFIKQIPPGIDEICILAGDIGNPYHSNYDIFMQFISMNFMKAFVIPGNHEYYNKHKTIQQTNDFMKYYFQKFHNISFLNNEYEIYEDYCFIGTTLWSKITNPVCTINDVYQIPHFDYKQYNELNLECIKFLEDTLQKDDIGNDKCIIITHHMPSSSLIHIKYKTPDMMPYNQWFYCDMDGFIETHAHKIKCWIYGHTHTPSDTIIHQIPFLCNPIGYPNENKYLNFQKNITIE